MKEVTPAVSQRLKYYGFNPLIINRFDIDIINGLIIRYSRISDDKRAKIVLAELLSFAQKYQAILNIKSLNDIRRDVCQVIKPEVKPMPAPEIKINRPIVPAVFNPVRSANSGRIHKARGNKKELPIPKSQLINNSRRCIDCGDPLDSGESLKCKYCK